MVSKRIVLAAVVVAILATASIKTYQHCGPLLNAGARPRPSYPRVGVTDRVQSYPQLAALVDARTMQPFAAVAHTQKPIVLCFFCGCDYCRKSAKMLATLCNGSRPDNLFAAFSIGPGDTEQFLNETRFPGTGLLDNDGSVAEHYNAAVCPRVFVLNGNRILYANTEGGSPLNSADLKNIEKYLSL